MNELNLENKQNIHTFHSHLALASELTNKRQHIKLPTDGRDDVMVTLVPADIIPEDGRGKRRRRVELHDQVLIPRLQEGRPI